MKFGILSIVISLIGCYFLYRFHTFIYETMLLSEIDILDQTKTTPVPELESYIRLSKIVSVSISLLGLYLGIMAYRKRPQVGVLSISFAVTLLLLSFVPFWFYMLEGGITEFKNSLS